MARERIIELSKFMPPHLTRVNYTFAEQHKNLNQLANYADARGNKFSLIWFCPFMTYLSTIWISDSVIYSQYLQFPLDFLSRLHNVLERV